MDNLTPQPLTLRQKISRRFSLFSRFQRLGIVALFLLVVLAIPISKHLRVSFFNSLASTSGPDEPILYGQDLGVGAGANLSDPAIRHQILVNVKGGFSKDRWNLAQLVDRTSTFPFFPPTRKVLLFQQEIAGPQTGQIGSVEGGHISMMINEPAANDDTLIDSYIPNIRPQDPVLSGQDAKDKVILPLDAQVSEPALVYHLAANFAVPVGGSTGRGPVIPTGTSEPLAPPGDNPPDKKESDQKQSFLSKLFAAIFSDEVDPAPDSASDMSASELPTPEEVPSESPLPDQATPSETLPPDEKAPDQVTPPSDTPQESPVELLNPVIPRQFIRDQLLLLIAESYHLAYKVKVSEGILPWIPQVLPGQPPAGGGRGRFVGEGADRLQGGGQSSLVGTGDGLNGWYRCVIGGSQVTQFNRIDATVNFDWGTGGIGGPNNCRDNFYIDWGLNGGAVGRLQPQYDEDYVLYFDVDESGDFYVCDDTCTHIHAPSPGEYQVTKHLRDDRYYVINGTMAEVAGSAHAKLSWSSPSTPKQIIPQTQLYSHYGRVPPLCKRMADVTIQEQQALTLTSSCSAPQGVYQWAKDGVNIPGANQFDYRIASAVVADSGTYTVRVTSPFGTTSRDVVVTVTPPTGGAGTGLRGYYYPNTFFGPDEIDGTYHGFNRIDPTINFDWGVDSPTLCPARQVCAGLIPRDGFSVRWYGNVYAPDDGIYTFVIKTNDGGRLWVDPSISAGTNITTWGSNNLLIDNWHIPDGAQLATRPIQLSRGLHRIRFDYYEGKGDAEAHLSWVRPNNSALVPIPANDLFPLDFNPPTPNVKVGDILWIDARTGQVIDTVDSRRD